MKLETASASTQDNLNSASSCNLRAAAVAASSSSSANCTSELSHPYKHRHSKWQYSGLAAFTAALHTFQRRAVKTLNQAVNLHPSAQTQLQPPAGNHPTQLHGEVHLYSFMNFSWKLLNFDTNSAIFSSRGRMVVRKWKVPSAWPKPLPGTVLMPAGVKQQQTAATEKVSRRA
jgi:hypothetical protein